MIETPAAMKYSFPLARRKERARVNQQRTSCNGRNIHSVVQQRSFVGLSQSLISSLIYKRAPDCSVDTVAVALIKGAVCFHKDLLDNIRMGLE